MAPPHQAEFTRSGGKVGLGSSLAGAPEHSLSISSADRAATRLGRGPLYLFLCLMSPCMYDPSGGKWYASLRDGKFAGMHSGQKVTLTPRA